MKKMMKVIAWVIGVFLVLGIIGSCMSDDATSNDTETPVVEQNEVVAEPTKEEKEQAEAEALAKKEAEEQKAKEEAEAKAKAEEERKAKEQAQAEIQSQIEQDMLNIMKENLDGMADVTFDKESKFYVVTPTSDSLIREIAMTFSGQIDSDSWDTMVSSMAYMSENMSNNLGNGYSVAFTNPANPDNYLIVIVDGVVIYNAIDEI